MRRKNSALIESELRQRRASSVFEHHEEIAHPNEQRNGSFASDVDDGEPFSWPKSRFVRWFLKIDESHLKPFFIRKYSRVKQALEDEYQALLKEKVDAIDDQDEDEIMKDKVEAMTAANTRNQRALSQFTDRQRALSAMADNQYLGTSQEKRTQDNAPGFGKNS